MCLNDINVLQYDTFVDEETFKLMADITIRFNLEAFDDGMKLLPKDDFYNAIAEAIQNASVQFNTGKKL